MISILQMVPTTPQEKVLKFEGVFSTTLEEELEILVTDENTDLVLKVKTNHLLEQLDREIQDIDTLINILPIQIKCRVTTTKIIEILSIESDEDL